MRMTTHKMRNHCVLHYEVRNMGLISNQSICLSHLRFSISAIGNSNNSSISSFTLSVTLTLLSEINIINLLAL